MSERAKTRLLVVSEMTLVCAGLLLLASVFVISQTGNFDVWVAAKALYAVGVLIFLFT